MYIPGYGDVRTADFSKPPDPAKMAPGVGPLRRQFPARPSGNAFLEPDQILPVEGRLEELIDARIVPSSIPPPVVPVVPVRPIVTKDDDTKDDDTKDTPRPPSLPRTEVFRYPAELPALTPEQQALLASRRRAASRQFEETEASVARQRQRAEAEALRAQGEIARQQQLQSRSGMQTLAGRGVARSPMFVNPFQRQLAEQAQRQVGQLQSGLADTLAQLEGALRQADIGRERELAQIDFDAASFRSDVARLLGG